MTERSVKNYFNPKPSCIVQWYKFNTRTRASGNSAATYVAALRELAGFCNYKDSLQEMLRDQIACGVNYESIQRRSEKGLTYVKALEIAQTIESGE